MVEVVNKVSLRGQRRRDRMQKLKEARPQTGVRVVPTDERFRKLKHPNGMAFRSEGGVEWPNDRFTKRRIAEGAVKLDEDKHHRDRDRARKSPERSETTS